MLAPHNFSSLSLVIAGQANWPFRIAASTFILMALIGGASYSDGEIFTVVISDMCAGSVSAESEKL